MTPEERVERLMVPATYEKHLNGWIARRHGLVGLGSSQLEALRDLNEKENRHTHEPLPEHFEQAIFEAKEAMRQAIRRNLNY